MDTLASLSDLRLGKDSEESCELYTCGLINKETGMVVVVCCLDVSLDVSLVQASFTFVIQVVGVPPLILALALVTPTGVTLLLDEVQPILSLITIINL